MPVPGWQHVFAPDRCCPDGYELIGDECAPFGPDQFDCDCASGTGYRWDAPVGINSGAYNLGAGDILCGPIGTFENNSCSGSGLGEEFVIQGGPYAGQVANLCEDAVLTLTAGDCASPCGVCEELFNGVCSDPCAGADQGECTCGAGCSWNGVDACVPDPGCPSVTARWGSGQVLFDPQQQGPNPPWRNWCGAVLPETAAGTTLLVHSSGFPGITTSSSPATFACGTDGTWTGVQAGCLIGGGPGR